MQPTASLLARISRKLRLTTKQSSVRGGYYKGTGSGAMGRHTKHGGYIIDPAKVRTYVVPSGLNESKVRQTPLSTEEGPRENAMQSRRLTSVPSLTAYTFRITENQAERHTVGKAGWEVIPTAVEGTEWCQLMGIRCYSGSSIGSAAS